VNPHITKKRGVKSRSSLTSMSFPL